MQAESVFASLPMLRTERLVLRRIVPGDAEDVFGYASDPEVARWTTWDAHKSIEDSRRFLRAVMESYENGEPAPWAIALKCDEKLIGTCGFRHWWPADHRAEIAYALSRRYWGQGYMTEAVRAVIDFGFREMGLNRIEGHCRVENVASARVMEKVGMRTEGLLRQHVLVKGAFGDMKIYSVLKQEWSCYVRG